MTGRTILCNWSAVLAGLADVRLQGSVPRVFKFSPRNRRRKTDSLQMNLRYRHVNQQYVLA